MTDGSGLKQIIRFFLTIHSFIHDLYPSDLMREHHDLHTKYEKIWSLKGKSIKYMKFKFDD